MEFKLKEKSLLRLAISTVLASYSIDSFSNSTITVDSTLTTSNNPVVNNSPSAISHDLSNNTGHSATITIDGNADGHISGSNLFFSFSQFGVGAGDTALFTCPGCTGLSNVITRVTGNAASVIDGTVASNINGANFWFFNPYGVVFGQGAVIDMPAAFHISDATRILDSGGSHFFAADPTNSASSLSISPASFGFVTGDPHDSTTGVVLDGVTITAGMTVDSASTTKVPNTDLVIGSGGSAEIEIQGTSIVVKSTASTPTTSTLVGSDININSQTNITIANNGSLTLTGDGGNTSITAANNIFIEGDGTSTGYLTDSQTAGTANIRAGHDLVLGSDGAATPTFGTGAINIQTGNAAGNVTISAVDKLTLGDASDSNSVGKIDKTSGNGDLVVETTGSTGLLSVNHSGSEIKDSSTGTGSLTVSAANDISVSQLGLISAVNGADLNIGAAGNLGLDDARISNNGNLNLTGATLSFSSTSSTLAATTAGQSVAIELKATNSSSPVDVKTSSTTQLTETAGVMTLESSFDSHNSANITNLQNFTGDLISNGGSIVNEATGHITGNLSTAQGTNALSTVENILNRGEITGNLNSLNDIFNIGVITLNAASGNHVLAGRDLVMGSDGQATPTFGTGVINITQANNASGQTTISAGRNLTLGGATAATGTGKIDKTSGGGELLIATTGTGVGSGLLSVNTGEIKDTSTGNGNLVVEAAAGDIIAPALIQKTGSGSGQMNIIAAGGNLQFSGANIQADHAGDVNLFALGSIEVTGDASFSNSGSATLNAGSAIALDGTGGVSGSLADQYANQLTANSNGNFILDNGVTLSLGSTASTGHAGVFAGHNVYLDGTLNLRAAGTSAVQAGNDLILGEAITLANVSSFNTGIINISQDAAATGNVTISAAGNLTLGGATAATGTGKIDKISGGGELLITTTGSNPANSLLSVHTGEIKDSSSGNGNLVVKAAVGDIIAPALIQKTGSGSGQMNIIAAGGNLQFSGANIQADHAGDVNLFALGSIEVTGDASFSNSGSVTLNAGSAIALDGTGGVSGSLADHYANQLTANSNGNFILDNGVTLSLGSTASTGHAGVFAGHNVYLDGTLNLRAAGASAVQAGNDLILGEAITLANVSSFNTGIINISQDAAATGNVTISAAGNLSLGVLNNNNSLGKIDKTSGNGSLLVETTGSTGLLSVNHSGSEIKDSSTGTGSLTVSAANDISVSQLGLISAVNGADLNIGAAGNLGLDDARISNNGNLNLTGATLSFSSTSSTLAATTAGQSVAIELKATNSSSPVDVKTSSTTQLTETAGVMTLESSFDSHNSANITNLQNFTGDLISNGGSIVNEATGHITGNLSTAQGTNALSTVENILNRGEITGNLNSLNDIFNIGVITLNAASGNHVLAGRDLVMGSDGQATPTFGTGVINITQANNASGQTTISAGRNLTLGGATAATGTGKIDKTSGGGELLIATTGTGVGSGLLSVNTGEIKDTSTGNGNLVVEAAAGDIIAPALIQKTGSGSGQMNIIAAGGNLQFSGANIQADHAGDVNLFALGSIEVTGDASFSNSGSATLNAGSAIALDGTGGVSGSLADQYANQLTANSNGNFILDNGVTLSLGSTASTGHAGVFAGHNVYLDGTLNLRAAGTSAVQAGNDLILGEAITLANVSSFNTGIINISQDAAATGNVTISAAGNLTLGGATAATGTGKIDKISGGGELLITTTGSNPANSLLSVHTGEIKDSSSGNGNLVVKAAVGDIIAPALIQKTGSGSGQMNIIAAGGNLQFSGANIQADHAGDVNLFALGSIEVTGDASFSNSGSVTLNAGSAIALDGTGGVSGSLADHYANQLTANSNGNFILDNGVTLSLGSTASTGHAGVFAGHNVYLDGTLNLRAAGASAVQAGNDLILGEAITLANVSSFNTGIINISQDAAATGNVTISAAGNLTLGGATAATGTGKIDKTSGGGELLITTTGSNPANSQLSVHTGEIKDSSSGNGNLVVKAAAGDIIAPALIQKTGSGSGQMNIIAAGGNLQFSGANIQADHAGDVNLFALGSIEVTGDASFSNSGSITLNAGSAIALDGTGGVSGSLADHYANQLTANSNGNFILDNGVTLSLGTTASSGHAGVFAGHNVYLDGTLNLRAAGASAVQAGNDLILGEAITLANVSSFNTGIINISQDAAATGNVTISAAGNLSLGVLNNNNSLGKIDKTSGNGDLVVETTGSTGLLSVNHSGSEIKDSSTGTGSLTVSAANDISVSQLGLISAVNGADLNISAAGNLGLDNARISNNGNLNLTGATLSFSSTSSTLAATTAGQSVEIELKATNSSSPVDVKTSGTTQLSETAGVMTLESSFDSHNSADITNLQNFTGDLISNGGSIVNEATGHITGNLSTAQGTNALSTVENILNRGEITGNLNSLNDIYNIGSINISAAGIGSVLAGHDLILGWDGQGTANVNYGTGIINIAQSDNSNTAIKAVNNLTLGVAGQSNSLGKIHKSSGSGELIVQTTGSGGVFSITNANSGITDQSTGSLFVSSSHGDLTLNSGAIAQSGSNGDLTVAVLNGSLVVDNLNASSQNALIQSSGNGVAKLAAFGNVNVQNGGLINFGNTGNAIVEAGRSLTLNGSGTGLSTSNGDVANSSGGNINVDYTVIPASLVLASTIQKTAGDANSSLSINASGVSSLSTGNVNVNGITGVNNSAQIATTTGSLLSINAAQTATFDNATITASNIANIVGSHVNFTANATTIQQSTTTSTEFVANSGTKLDIKMNGNASITEINGQMVLKAVSDIVNTKTFTGDLNSLNGSITNATTGTINSNSIFADVNLYNKGIINLNIADALVGASTIQNSITTGNDLYNGGTINITASPTTASNWTIYAGHDVVIGADGPMGSNPVLSTGAINISNLTGDVNVVAKNNMILGAYTYFPNGSTKPTLISHTSNNYQTYALNGSAGIISKTAGIGNLQVRSGFSIAENGQQYRNNSFSVVSDGLSGLQGSGSSITPYCNGCLLVSGSASRIIDSSTTKPTAVGVFDKTASLLSSVAYNTMDVSSVGNLDVIGGKITHTGKSGVINTYGNGAVDYTVTGGLLIIDPVVIGSSIALIDGTLSSSGKMNIDSNESVSGSNTSKVILDHSSISAITLEAGTPGTSTLFLTIDELTVDFIANFSNISIGSGGFGASNSNFIIDTSSGNNIFSADGEIFLQENNKNDLAANPNNLFEPLGFAGSYLAGGNLFINAVGVQPSSQNTNLIASETIIVSRPMESPDVPSEPCATGSSLEQKNSNGVLPSYAELLPFSVVPDQDQQAKASAFMDELAINLASNSQAKKISCEKA